MSSNFPLDQSGQGSTDSKIFTPPGRVKLCWELSYADRPANVEPQVRPGVGFVIFRSGASAKTDSVPFQNQDGCQAFDLPKGDYFVRVVSPFTWVRWRLIVVRT